MKIPVRVQETYRPEERLLYEAGEDYLRKLATVNYNNAVAFQSKLVSGGYMDSTNVKPLEARFTEIEGLKEDLISENKVHDTWVYPIDTLEGFMSANSRMDGVIVANPVLQKRIEEGRLRSFKRETWTELYESTPEEHYNALYGSVMSGVVHTPTLIKDSALGVPLELQEYAQEEGRNISVETASTIKTDTYTDAEISRILYTYDSLEDYLALGKL